MKYTVRAIALTLFCFLPLTASWGQDSLPRDNEPLTIGVFVDPPFVTENNGTYSGMAIELWQMLAENLDRQYHYVTYPNFSALVQATQNEQVDVAVTNLTITRDRAERVDFTHPWFDAGQRIMVNDSQGAGFGAVVAGLQQSGHLTAYAWIAFVIVIATILLTFFDRRFDRDFPGSWTDGVAESFYTVMSVATSGRPPSRKNLFGWIGRIWQGLWLACGIAVLAYVTSSVTSVMTTLAITSHINSFADLPGKTVGVLRGSVSEDFVRGQGLSRRGYANIEDAATALVAGEIEAIVGDAPVLEYYASTHADQSVSVVGAIFEPDKYGFALPTNSALTRALTVELIGAHESGQIEAIRARYFGQNP